MATLPTFDDVESAARQIEGAAHRTPVVSSRTIDARTGAQLFFKCENLQRAGAFKFRGAYNALSRLSADERRRGVVTFSSGNHAQAIALAGQVLNIPRVIVMPADAPVVKRIATEGYGGEVVLYDRDREDREAIGRRLAHERGLTLIPPYDHPHIIAGQGTAARELIEEKGALDYLFVPCGGGGLLSGSAIAAKALAPACAVIGVEPAAGDDMTTVDDPTLLRTMFYLWERLKLVVEPTGALGAAAAMEGTTSIRGARVGVILSGGNVDLAQVGHWMASA